MRICSLLPSRHGPRIGPTDVAPQRPASRWTATCSGGCGRNLYQRVE